MSIEFNDGLVSIHASVKDATHLYVIVQNNASFNPRICKRCDTSTSFSS